jgi:hypothetical protein
VRVAYRNTDLRGLSLLSLSRKRWLKATSPQLCPANLPFSTGGSAARRGDGRGCLGCSIGSFRSSSSPVWSPSSASRVAERWLHFVPLHPWRVEVWRVWSQISVNKRVWVWCCLLIWGAVGFFSPHLAGCGSEEIGKKGAPASRFEKAGAFPGWCTLAPPAGRPGSFLLRLHGGGGGGVNGGGSRDGLPQ